MLNLIRKDQIKTTMLALTVLGIFLVSCGAQVTAIARGYSTDDEGLATGMVAALSESGDSEVERADQSSGKRIVGVVTTTDSSSVTVASGDSQVLIESEGDVQAYISDIGGAVEKGDLLTLSPLRGILMKATDNATGSIIGVAAQDSSSVQETEVTKYMYSDGNTSKSTQIVKIKINLNKQGANTTGQSTEPSPLSKIGESVTGKRVSDIRVLAALIIFILVLIAEGGIIYGAVTSAVTALGRNPLARKMIRREMLRIIIVAIGVLGVGLAAVYGILWY